MNPNRPFTNDPHREDGDQEIEQRLKKLQPQPVQIDASQLLAAAADTTQRDSAPNESPVEPIGNGWRQEGSRAPKLIWFAATWTCGAVVGGLLTMLVLAPGQGSLEARNPSRPLDMQNTHDETIGSKPNDGMGTGDKTNGGTPPQNSQPRQLLDVPAFAERARRGDRWSHNEWLVSTELTEFRGPGAVQQPPLMAGNYALFLDPSRSAAGAVGVSGDDSTTSQESATSNSISNKSPLSTNPNQLLKELLGNPPPRM